MEVEKSNTQEKRQQRGRKNSMVGFWIGESSSRNLRKDEMMKITQATTLSNRRTLKCRIKIVEVVIWLKTD